MHLEEILNIIKMKKHVSNRVFVSICGAADTGKTTLATLISKKIIELGFKCDYICTDSFLIEREERLKQGITGYNLKALNQVLLKSYIDKISNSESVEYYPYDSKIGKNSLKSRFIENVEILIIEGIHSFNEAIADKVAIKIFVDSDDNTLRDFRYKANISKRGFTEILANRNIDLEMQEYYQFIDPNKRLAEIVIHVDKNYNYR